MAPDGWAAAGALTIQPESHRSRLTCRRGRFSQTLHLPRARPTRMPVAARASRSWVPRQPYALPAGAASSTGPAPAVRQPSPGSSRRKPTRSEHGLDSPCAPLRRIALATPNRSRDGGGPRRQFLSGPPELRRRWFHLPFARTRARHRHHQQPTRDSLDSACAHQGPPQTRAAPPPALAQPAQTHRSRSRTDLHHATGAEADRGSPRSIEAQVSA